MARAGNVLNIISEKSDKKTIERAIPFVNPEASDAACRIFAKAFSSLSENTLKGLQRTDTSDISLNKD